MSQPNAGGPASGNNPFQNTQNPEAAPQADATGSNKGPWGCILWGCLGVAVFSIFGMLLAGFFTYRFLTGQVEKYTDLEAAEIPVVEYDDEALEKLNQRLEQFQTQVRGPDAEDSKSDADSGDTEESGASDEAVESTLPSEPIQELRLSAEEINALIGANEQLKGKVYVRIEDGQLSGQVSIPTDMIPGGKGRFFNADADFSVSMENGVLVVRLTGARVKGEPIPDEVMEGFSQQNLAKDAYNDAENAELLRKIESIQVVEDSILLKLRPVDAIAEGEGKEIPEPEVDAAEEDAAVEELGEAVATPAYNAD